MSNTPSQLREILEDLVMGMLGKRQPKFTETGSLSDYEQTILALFMECLPEQQKNIEYNEDIEDCGLSDLRSHCIEIGECFGFNQAIDITAQHMRALTSQLDVKPTASPLNKPLKDVKREEQK